VILSALKIEFLCNTLCAAGIQVGTIRINQLAIHSHLALSFTTEHLSRVKQLDIGVALANLGQFVA
jgi:hypothetical protein